MQCGIWTSLDISKRGSSSSSSSSSSMATLVEVAIQKARRQPLEASAAKARHQQPLPWVHHYKLPQDQERSRHLKKQRRVEELRPQQPLRGRRKVSAVRRSPMMMVGTQTTCPAPRAPSPAVGSCKLWEHLRREAGRELRRDPGGGGLHCSLGSSPHLELQRCPGCSLFFLGLGSHIP